ncbi:hypothetical protein AKJ51_01885 [candidate division MSBL1 archaeon SCGC-AAA382A20]|uniref:Aminopeptidase n=1 Tax=candidate division MSBL1 archaeon SCGC-AAA382A20 TaxID=1698280 RepID=A0A133VL66_9EURY|nr:hypothetical protein AKJ51_01885 [candidate division MSBL1 archaeon SCGC-AAA382A20]
MDSRIREHAKVLADWSTEIGKDDNILIRTSDSAQELVIALYEEIAKREAKPLTVFSDNESMRAYLKNYEGELDTPEHFLASTKKSDVVISISSDPNLMAMNDVHGRKIADLHRAWKPIQEERMAKRWCVTQHPTNAQAQMADMSLEEYKDFVYGAVLIDWEELHDKQETLREKLNEASQVYIEGPKTEITLSIEGMIAENSDGKKNMPSGEVFTAPVLNSAKGKIFFDKPVIFQGHEIEGVKLTFEGGEVTDYTANRGEESLKSLLSTDDGSKRLGELGIGTNRNIDRFTKNILFDEKMGGTIHMALGRAYEENVGKSQKRNESAIHVDMIKDMSEGKMELDGEPILEKGKFPWEH